MVAGICFAIFLPGGVLKNSIMARIFFAAKVSAMAAVTNLALAGC